MWVQKKSLPTSPSDEAQELPRVHRATPATKPRERFSDGAQELLRVLRARREQNPWEACVGVPPNGPELAVTAASKSSALADPAMCAARKS